MLEKLDKLDMKILFELDNNSRKTYSLIAKKLRISREALYYRIKKLEKLGIIKSYYTVIDIHKLGYLSFRVYIKLTKVNSEIEKRIINYLISKKEVGYVAKTYGYIDLNFLVYVKSVWEFEEFINNFKKKFNKYLDTIKISLFTQVINFPRRYLLSKEELRNIKEKPQDIFLMDRSEEEKIDKIDFEILKFISKNARISYVDLANKLGLSDRAILYRLKNLEKRKIIEGYKILLNLEKLDVFTYKLDILFDDFKEIDEFINFCRVHPNIIILNRTIGGTDGEIDIEVKSIKELENLIEEIKSKFKVRNIFYFRIKEYYKLLFFPKK